MFAQLCDDLVGIGPIHALGSRFGHVHPVENGLFRLGTEPLERTHLLRLTRRPQLFQRGNSQLLKQDGRFLGSQPGNAQQRQHALRDLRQQRLQLRKPTGSYEGHTLLGHRLPDSVDVGQLIRVLFDHLGHRLRHVADGTRAVAVGAHAKRVGALELQQVGQFIQGCGDLGIAQHRATWDGRSPSLNVQFNDVAIVHDVVTFDMRPVVNVTPPHPGVLQLGCEVLVNHFGHFQQGSAGRIVYGRS